jgi:hypothetical protein
MRPAPGADAAAQLKAVVAARRGGKRSAQRESEFTRAFFSMAHTSHAHIPSLGRLLILVPLSSSIPHEIQLRRGEKEAMKRQAEVRFAKHFSDGGNFGVSALFSLVS